jgi:hypothetical protein
LCSRAAGCSVGRRRRRRTSAGGVARDLEQDGIDCGKADTPTTTEDRERRINRPPTERAARARTFGLVTTEEDRGSREASQDRNPYTASPGLALAERCPGAQRERIA